MDEGRTEMRLSVSEGEDRTECLRKRMNSPVGITGHFNKNGLLFSATMSGKI